MGQGIKCLGWELLGGKWCEQSPGIRLRQDKLDFVSSPRSMRSLTWSATTAMPLPALANTSVPVATGGQSGEG